MTTRLGVNKDFTIYLNGDSGLDTNSGLSSLSPIKTWAKALTLIPDIIFDRMVTVQITGDYDCSANGFLDTSSIRTDANGILRILGEWTLVKSGTLTAVDTDGSSMTLQDAGQTFVAGDVGRVLKFTSGAFSAKTYGGKDVEARRFVILHVVDANTVVVGGTEEYDLTVPGVLSLLWAVGDTYEVYDLDHTITGDLVDTNAITIGDADVLALGWSQGDEALDPKTVVLEKIHVLSASQTGWYFLGAHVDVIDTVLQVGASNPTLCLSYQMGGSTYMHGFGVFGPGGSNTVLGVLLKRCMLRDLGRLPQYGGVGSVGVFSCSYGGLNMEYETQGFLRSYGYWGEDIGDTALYIGRNCRRLELTGLATKLGGVRIIEDAYAVASGWRHNGGLIEIAYDSHLAVSGDSAAGSYVRTVLSAGATTQLYYLHDGGSLEFAGDATHTGGTSRVLECRDGDLRFNSGTADLDGDAKAGVVLALNTTFSYQTGDFEIHNATVSGIDAQCCRGRIDGSIHHIADGGGGAAVALACTLCTKLWDNGVVFANNDNDTTTDATSEVA